MSEHRLRTIVPTLVAGSTVTALTVFGLHAATPASAEPDLKTVKATVERLNHEAEVASERYNTAQEELTSAQTTLSALNADLARQQQVVSGMRDDIAAMVVSNYQSQALSTASQLALSDNPDAFLDRLSAVSAYDTQRGEQMSEYAVQLQRLELRKDAVTQENDDLAKTQKQLAQQKSIIDDKAAQAQSMLDKLEAEARAKLLAGDYTGALPSIDANGPAATALRYAMAQIGKAYVYGAAGPSAFDCSGLMMRAWGAAGVGLSHSSRAQIGEGRRISESELQPGDLVFYYSPISHVGMYIGNGLIVNALNPSAGVRVSALHSMPYSGAVRPG